MQPQRLVIVTRKFWPISGPTELAVADLGCALKAAGSRVEIITSRWEKNWPAEFAMRDIRVTRLARPGNGPWGNYRFQRALARHLETEHDSGDPVGGAIVFGIGLETETVCRQLGQSVPVVTRIDSRALAGVDCSGAVFKRAINALQPATAISVDAEFVTQRIAPFLESDPVQLIPDIVSAACAEPVRRSAATRNAARRAISDAHPILSLEEDHPLVVCGMPMDGDAGLLDIVAAWPTVLQACPRAKLWLCGDGKFGRRVWEAITKRELVHDVILPGYFDDLTELFQSADLYVHPARTPAACNMLTRAMANGMGVVSTQTDFTAGLVRNSKGDNKATGLLVSSEQPGALAEAVIHGLQNSELRDRIGLHAQQRVRQTMSSETTAREYLELLRPRYAEKRTR